VTVFYDASGNVMDTYPGSIPADQLREHIEALLSG